MSRQLTEEGRQLVADALRHEEPIVAGAEQRVWRKLRHVQGREMARSAARPMWQMFFAGATIAGLLALVFVARERRDHVTGTALPVQTQAALVQLPDNGEIVVGANSHATVTRMDAHDFELRLERGTLLVHASARGARGPFIVRTPQFVARVVGTVFRVAVDDDGASRISVAHGAVEVEPVGQAPRVVHTHESWPEDARNTPSAQELQLLPPLEPVTLNDFGAPSRSCVGEPETRLRCELAVAKDASPREAENALYQAALIAWRELHDTRRALTLWRLQRERFPNGALRHEVQASMIDALVASRSLREAEREIETYLAAEPDDLRAPELHFVLGTIERDLDGNCTRAKLELERSLAQPGAAWASRARTALHGCTP